jgi:transcriptional regulator with XRE-family HTH domain
MDGLGSRIRIARAERTQEELAAILNVDRTTLGSWEIDRREPDLEHLVEIANIADVSIDWLAGWDCTPPDQAKIYNSYEWHQIIDFATINNITPEKLNGLIKAALALKA